MGKYVGPALVVGALLRANSSLSFSSDDKGNEVHDTKDGRNWWLSADLQSSPKSQIRSGKGLFLRTKIPTRVKSHRAECI